MNRRPAGAIPALGVGYVLVSCALAGLLWWPVYATWRVVLVVAVGAVVGVGLALLARRLGWSGWTTALVAFGGYLLIAVPVAVPYRSTGPGELVRGGLEAAAGVVVGWRQLLSLRLPVEDYRAVLAPLLAAVLAAAVVATRAAVRSDRAAAWAVPTLGTLILLGPAFGPVEPGAAARLGVLVVPDARTTVPGVGFVVVSLAWFVVRARVRRARALAVATASTGGRHPARSASRVLVPPALGLGVAAVALVVAVLVAPLATDPGARRTVRAGVEPVLTVQSQPSPLDRYRAAFAGAAAAEPLLTVSVSGTAVDRLRMAVLDQYDGQHFTMSTTGADQQLVRLPRTSTGGAVSRLDVQVGAGLAGIWLPVPQGVLAAPTFSGSRADQLSAAFYVSSATGAAVDVASSGVGQVGLRPGDRYVVAVGRQPDGQLGEPARSTLIDVQQYPELAAWVKAQGQPRSAAGLTELLRLLRARGYLSHWLTASDAASWIAAEDPGYSFVPAYAGHSRSRVEQLFAELTDQQKAVGPGASDAELVAAVGDDEQFATAGALLARYLGFDSRVVEGVRLGGSTDPSVTTCTSVCTGADLAAWVEVRSPGGSWVALDTDPQVAQAPRPVTQGQEPPSNPTRVRQPDPTVADPPQTSQDSAADRSAPSPEAVHRTGWWVAVLRVAALSLLAVLLLAAPLAAVPALKAWRRHRRRRSAVPEVVVVGAWAELADRCLDLGLPLDGPTRRVAARASGRVGAVALAELVEEAVFAPSPPGPEVAADAWELTEQDLAAVHADLAPARRALAAVRLRSLWRALRGERAGDDPSRRADPGASDPSKERS